MMTIQFSKGSKRLLLMMPLVALAIVISGLIYFHTVNRSEDPRILAARNDFARYNRLMRDNRFSEALVVLDGIESVYRSTPGYADSFELGVVENNRASVFLVRAETERLSQDRPPEALIASYLNAAQKHSQAAIDIYEAWLAIHRSLSRSQLMQFVSAVFHSDRHSFGGANLGRIIDKRVSDIQTAVEEMPRRLSVTHTNLGVIARYQGRTGQARQHYETAISLWGRNHVARNNLDVLLGRPAKTPSLLERLFPPSRTAP